MAAEMVGGAFLSASLQVLFDRMASPDILGYLKEKKFNHKLLQKLKITLLSVKAVLNDAEVKQITDSSVTEWLTELEDAVYDGDDLLDEIEYDALQFKFEAESRTGISGVSNFVSSLLDSNDQDIETKMEEILETLEIIVKQKDVIGLREGIGEKPFQRLPTTSLVEESEVYGRDGDKEKIIKLLLVDGNEGSDTFSVIPIVGLGGIGKTTLAQSVYNDCRVHEHFELRSWECVSEEFDVSKVTKSILCSLPKSHSNSYDNNNLDSLQNALKEELKGKKFLIVLDDVWNQNYVNWENLRKPFEHGAQGSKILVTTRNEEVARIMHTVPSYNLGHLSDEDCWQLFAKHAFHNTDYNAYPVLVTTGRKIVKKCKGLPLAAKTLGGLLRSIVDVAEWERVLESEIWELKYDESNILPALMLSYHHLPSHIKRCFAFCSVFPKDYKFQRHQLVLYWMAENLVQPKNRNRRMEDVGDVYFNELLSRSFFQRYTGWSGESIFVMHDLVHDLARFVTRGYSFTLETGNSNGEVMKVRHLAATQNLSLESLGSISKAVHLRSLLFLDQYSSFDHLSNIEAVYDAILKCRCLRILSLFGTNLERLSESIGELKHLRFLDLSRSSIERLPNSVTKLYNLQTLKLSRCYKLTELPEDMHHLINLRHLDIRGCGNLKKMPRGIGEMKSLQTLSTFIVGKDDGARIEELRELSDLHGQIALKNLGNVKSATDASEARLMDKERIRGLNLHWSDWYGDTEAGANEREVAEKLLPHTNLASVSIIRYGGTSFPSWLGDVSFRNIVSIILESCRNCSSLPPLGQLPFLKYLKICGVSEVVSVGAEFLCGIGGSSPVRITPFASLESLQFLNMSKWEEWCLKIGVENGEAFPRLQQLYIGFCDKLRRVDWTDCLPCLTILSINARREAGILESMSLPKTPILRELRIGSRSSLLVQELPQKVEDLVETTSLMIYCNGVYISPITSLSERIRSCIAEIHIWDCNSLVFFHLDLFPNLCILTINGCQRLECVGVSSSSSSSANGDGLQCLTSLSSITIDDCKKLKKVLPEQMHDLLPSLACLYIYGCPELESFPKGGLPSNLECLSIANCPELESFPEGGLPSNLKSLSIWECPKLTANRMAWNLQTLPALERFSISDVEGAESFPEEGFLPSSVSNLDIDEFPNLKRLDIKGLQQLTSLQNLSIEGCPQLEKLPPQGLPTSLTLFEISGVEGAESFPEDGLLPSSLSSLVINDFPNLKRLDIKGLQQLTSLQNLTITWCPQLEKLPPQGLPASLTFLQIGGCPLLQQRCKRDTGEDWHIISHIPQVKNLEIEHHNPFMPRCGGELGPMFAEMD